MDLYQNLQTGILENWPIWFLSAAMIVAAVIDGVRLKVPNWLTLPLIVSGWGYSAAAFAFHGDAWWQGLAYSLLGTAVGLALLLPAYAIGGMGAGDVKLLMGCGAWVHATATVSAFCVAAIIGGILAIGMALASRSWSHHYRQFWKIADEILTIKRPEKLAELAAARKESMRKLPYGIPLTLGALVYFCWMGLLI